MLEATLKGYVARVEYMLQHLLECIKFFDYLTSRLEWTGADFVPVL
jgi:hypothetical protein